MLIVQTSFRQHIEVELNLENRDGPLTKFNEDDWYSFVEYATVYGKDDIRFTFKNGMEVKA